MLLKLLAILRGDSLSLSFWSGIFDYDPFGFFFFMSLSGLYSILLHYLLVCLSNLGINPACFAICSGINELILSLILSSSARGSESEPESLRSS